MLRSIQPRNYNFPCAQGLGLEAGVGLTIRGGREGFVIHSGQNRERGHALRYKTSGALVLLAMLSAAASAWAHHSPSSIFDMSQKFVLTGTLTQVEWVNPHIAVYIDAKKSDGTVENWKFESAPPSWLRRVGVNRSDFVKAVGQTVTVEGNRARDGSLYGFLLKITFADGSSLAMVSGRPPAAAPAPHRSAKGGASE